MQVILLQDIRNLGALGDQVEVKAGYGRNFLIPQGKAVPATKTSAPAFLTNELVSLLIPPSTRIFTSIPLGFNFSSIYFLSV